MAERELDPRFKAVLSYPSFFEDRFYDFRMNMNIDHQRQGKQIVMAAIDDDSLKKIGRWPWTRTVWSRFIRKMNKFGAKVIAFDVFFSEPEEVCNLVSPDVDLSKAVKEFNSVAGRKIILPYSLDIAGTSSFEELPEALYDFIMDTKQTEGQNLQASQVSKSVWPIPELLAAGPSLAHIEATEDYDGIFRHYKLVGNVETLYLPSFSLLTYQLYTDSKPVLEIQDYTVARLKLATGDLELNVKGESKIRWFGDYRFFPTVPIFRILDAPDDDPEMIKIFQDKIIFVGQTAFGGHDLRHTPIDAMLPGVYLHANMTQMLLDGAFFKGKDSSIKISWAIMLICTLLIIVIQSFGHALVDLLVIFLLTVGTLLFDIYYLTPIGHEIKLFFCLFSMVAVYSWNTLLNFYLTSREKKQIRGTFSRFVAPAIVDQMLSDPSKVKVGGEKKHITVFFSDVRDFTSISEKLSPEDLTTCLNIYMGKMTDILFENFGTLDKYIGDAIVAYWGAPIDVENHAYHAVKAALKMIEALPAINKNFKKQGFPQFKHGIGLNTGDCSVGNMGSDKIFSYTALGDNMNLGARLEGLCKFYGSQLIISEYTKDAIPPKLQDELDFRILDKVRVKGKEQAVTIYEVMHSFHPFKLDQVAFEDYQKCFDLYQKQHFSDAINKLNELCEQYPEDKSCQRLIGSCEQYLQEPPPDDWDGVTTYTNK